MTTLEITLSDDVARKASAAGLLTRERLDEMLSAEIRRGAGDHLLEIMAKISEVNDLAPMSPEDVADEIRLMRAERRQGMERLWENMSRMQAVPDDDPMSPEDIADDMRAIRAAKRRV